MHIRSNSMLLKKKNSPEKFCAFLESHNFTLITQQVVFINTTSLLLKCQWEKKVVFLLIQKRTLQTKSYKLISFDDFIFCQAISGVMCLGTD